MTKRGAWTTAGLLAAAGFVSVGYAWLDPGAVERRARVVEHLPPYARELRQLPAAGDWDSPRHPPEYRPGQSYTGPGWYPRFSPNGKFVAVTTSLNDRAPFLLKNVIGVLFTAALSLVVDAPFYHTVNVWDDASHRLTAVVTIKEADPHSGIAYRYSWSQDSRALLIYGRGRLPEDYDQSVALCLIYLPHEDALYRLSPCPEPWQRPDRRIGEAAER